ncbi:cation-dependent mannose-6-phosphate receptor-like [Saccoglossus kowalevskii]
MSVEVLYLFLFFAVCLVCSSNADCTVETTKEQKYISMLDPIKGSIFKITDESANYTYDISICAPLKDVGDSDVGCYQSNPQKTNGKIVGRITKTDIKTGTDWILLTYKGGDEYGTHCTNENRRAVIMIVCDPDILEGPATIIAENADKDSECYYLFEISSSVACTSGLSESSSSSSGGGGISVGSIISIIFFTLVGLYIIVGFLYQRLVVGAKGMEQIPNLSFWRELGNLIADGTDFLFRTKTPSEPRTYKGIGDDQLENMDDDDDRDDHLLPM